MHTLEPRKFTSLPCEYKLHANTLWSVSCRSVLGYEVGVQEEVDEAVWFPT